MTQLVTVHGTYTAQPSGTPLVGQVTFTPRMLLWVDQTAGVIHAGPVSVSLDNTGSFSVDLQATDDPDINPTGWTYEVSENFTVGNVRSYDISVPTADSGTGLNIANVSPVPPASGTATVVQGPTGATGPAGPTIYGGRRVLFLGDSITAGVGAAPGTLRFSTQSAVVAGSANAYEFVNAGHPGYRSDQLIPLLPALLAEGPQHCHIEVGTNDAIQGVSLATYSANVAALVSLCHAAQVPVSMNLITPVGASESAASPAIEQFNLWLWAWAAQNGVLLADTYAALVDPTTGQLAAGFNSGDDIHPNNAGHLAMAQVVAPVIVSGKLSEPFPVKSIETHGLIANPLFANTHAGWTDFGGSGTLVRLTTIAANTSTDRVQLDAGVWLVVELNPTGSAGTRFVGYSLDTTKMSPGDELLLLTKLWCTDTSNGVNASVNVTLYNGGAPITDLIDTTFSVNNPGPVAVTFTAPSVFSTPQIIFQLKVNSGFDVSGFIGQTQVYNLTALGLTSNV